eukprot:1579780-Rhodomonas_salina.2
MSGAVQEAIRRSMLRRVQLDEPYVAFRVSSEAGPGAALFLSSSMPIRDADMFFNTAASNPLLLVASNRGASGIDGVISSAVGYSRGLGRPVTLLIGVRDGCRGVLCVVVLRLIVCCRACEAQPVSCARSSEGLSCLLLCFCCEMLCSSSTRWCVAVVVLSHVSTATLTLHTHMYPSPNLRTSQRSTT